MKIVKILGGLGNQMFQFSLALSLHNKYPEETVKMDTSCFRYYPLHNGYELSKIFGVSMDSASMTDLIKVAYPYFNYRLWQIGSRIMPKRRSMLTQLFDIEFEPLVFDKNISYFDGYWQSEKYFKDIRPIILNSFKFRPFADVQNINLLKELNKHTTVSVHIRRGDYLKIPMYRDICTLDYYRNAVQYIKSMVQIDKFIIFSNDIDWCLKNSEHIFGRSNFIIVDWNHKENSFKDMQLMSLCTHNIVANSSFSWWGAWLNNNPTKIVIAPHKWTNGNLNMDTIPENWIKI